MSTNLKLTVNRISSYENKEAGKFLIRVTFNEEFDAVTKINGNFVEGKVNYIDFVPRYFKSMVLNLVPGSDIMYARCMDEQRDFGCTELLVILKGGKLEVTRSKFATGDEYITSDGETVQHPHAGYNTEIVNISVTDVAAAKLDRLMDKVFGL